MHYTRRRRKINFVCLFIIENTLQAKNKKQSSGFGLDLIIKNKRVLRNFVYKELTFSGQF